MSNFMFDGKKYALEIEEENKKLSNMVRQRGMVPKLVSILIGDDPASILYLNLKKKAGERVGVNVDIITLPSNISKNEVTNRIKSLNNNGNIHGIMVQLPLPESFSQWDEKDVIDSISPEKDVDGLQDDSVYICPVVKAVESIMKYSEGFIKPPKYPFLIAVIGASGFVGKKLISRFETYNSSIYKIEGLDRHSQNFGETIRNADIVISATGKANLITADMVKPGVVLIDVGSPLGDIDKKAYEKACFVSPVPGGVGPVTIACLIENVLESVNIRINE